MDRFIDHKVLLPAGATNDKGERICRWCHKPIREARRRSWCSADCVSAYMIRAGSVRPQVWSRDKGVCSECGLDSERLESIYRRMRQGRFKYGTRSNAYLRPIHEKWMRQIEARWPWVAIRAYDGKSFWEAHHVVSVKDGGGGCGLENYVTLCFGCHIKTFKRKK